MQRGGKKPIPRAVKEARGTLQKTRDREEMLGDISPSLSVNPPALPMNVADVWVENIAAAIANGARQCDAESFAEWCTMAAMLRDARTSAEPAPASYVAQFRMLGELFGLAGPKSRAGVRGAGELQKTANPFARNGIRK